jgi:hypothetical protein
MTEPGEITIRPPQKLVLGKEANLSCEKALRQRDYVIETVGAVKRIISRTTGQVSSPFHEIEVEVDQNRNIKALIGTLGTKKRAIAFKEDPETYQEQIVESEPFDKFRYDPDSELLLVNIGASERIMDPKTGKTIGDSFHEIRRNGNLLVGRDGALIYKIDPETGEKIGRGWHSIEEKDGKVIGRIGSIEEVID